MDAEFERQMLRFVEAARRRQETVHERVGCPRCKVGVGERCHNLSGGRRRGEVLKHPHRERLRADGIFER